MTLRAGSARVEITPEEPVPLSGYGGREQPSTGVHDPLFARALVLDDGAERVGIVSLDLLNVSRELVSRVRGRIATVGLAIDHLLLAATHTHAGPYVPARTLDIHPSLAADTDVDDAVARIEAGIVDAVQAAHARREPATIRVGRAENDAVPENRRAAGGVGGGVRVPRGEVDPELIVLQVETESRSALVVNLACHPVCTTPNERLLSADWPGRLARAFEDETVLFLNGAAGDVNPRDWSGERAGEAVYEYMDGIGREVAVAAEEAVADARDAAPIEDAPLGVERRELSLPTKDAPPVEEIDARLAALEDETEPAARRADRSYLRELRAIAAWDATRLPAELSTVEVGDVALLGLPGEAFVRHGLDCKAAARADTLLPVGYANGYVGYLPTLRELENGGYEVRTAKVAPEAIVAFRRAALDLVGEST